MDYTIHGSLEGKNLSVTVPARLAGALGLARGARVRWEVGPGRSLLLRPVKGDGKAPAAAVEEE